MPASSAAPTTSRASPRRPRTCSTCRGRRPGRAAAPPSADEPRASRPAANAAAKNHGSSSGPRPMCESGRPAQASRQPSRRPLPRSSDAGRSSPGPGDRTSPSRAERRACGARRRGGARARRASETRGAITGRPPSARAAFAASAAASPPWPSARAGADDAGPDRADATSKPSRLRPRERRRRRSRTATSPSKHGADRDGHLEEAALLSARTASESETGSAPPGKLHVRDAHARPSAAHTGASWLCSEQQTTGMPVERLRERAVLLGVTRRPPAAACTGASSRARPARRAGRGRA